MTSCTQASSHTYPWVANCIILLTVITDIYSAVHIYQATRPVYTPKLTALVVSGIFWDVSMPLWAWVVYVDFYVLWVNFFCEF